MTDDSDLPQHDVVRRLLAEARHDEPTPPEVVARLEATLAELQAELQADRVASAETAPVIDIGSRRRRLAAIGVMAAAAVVVAGVAVGQVLPQGTSSNDGATSAESDAGAGTDLQADGGDSGAGAATEPAPPEERSGKVEAGSALPEVSLDGDLDQTLTSLRSRSTRSAYAADALVACQVGDVGAGRQLLVQVDGQPGLVVFRAPVGARQEADLFVCGDPDPVRTLSLPAP